MIPGLANGPPFPEGAVKGSVVAVASLDKPDVPVFVGVCEIDVSALQDVRGARGHAVRGIHWDGDEVWGWSSSGRPGHPAPDSLPEWNGDIEEVGDGVGGLALEDKNDEKEEPAGGVSLSGGGGDDSKVPEPSTKGIIFTPPSCFTMLTISIRNRCCFPQCLRLRFISTQKG